MAENLRTRRAPVLALAAMMALYVVVFGTLTWRQQSNYGTFGFDMGIHDQGIWLTSRFTSPFVTVRGMNYYGHHVNLIAALYAPAYWLGAGPHFLYLTETIALAAGAIPLWLLARRRLQSPWWALVPAAVWLLHPSVQWMNWWHWHPETMAITPLLFAWWFAATHRWVAFAIAIGLALLCKEDVALAVLMLGIVLAVATDVRPRRAGLIAAAAGIAWFLACTRLVIPAILDATPFYERSLFPAFGDSLPSVLWGIVTSPREVLAMATEAGRLEYYLKLLGPFGLLVPVIGLPFLFIGAPQAGVNVLSSLPGTYDIRFQYSAMVLVGVAIAAVEGLGRISRWQPAAARGVAVVMAMSAAAANVAWSPSPIGNQFDTGVWAKRIPRHDVFDRAIEMMPKDASVSASYYIVPHVTHRRAAYEWPNPWISTNWGLSGEELPDPSTVEYVLLDRSLQQEPALVDRLTAPGGDYEVVLDEDAVLLARRRTR